MAAKRIRKNFVNYFQKWDGMGTLGIGMMAVGFLSIWLGFSFITYIVGVVGMVGGLAVFLYGSIGRAHEADLQNEVRLHAEALSFRELEEDAHFRRRVPKDNIEEHVFEGYILQDGLYLKKQKNGKLCSSEYLYAKMLTLCDAFYIKAVSFSYVEEKKETQVYEIFFKDLEAISVERSTLTLCAKNKTRFAAKLCFLCISYDGGKLLRLPVQDDIYTDRLAQELQKQAKTAL